MPLLYRYFFRLKDGRDIYIYAPSEEEARFKVKEEFNVEIDHLISRDPW